MSEEAAPLSVVPGTPDEPEMTIGARLRSTMAAEYAAPFLEELNVMQTRVEVAEQQSHQARGLADRMAARVAAEHRRRVEAEDQVALERARVQTLIATFSTPALPPAVRGHRWRRAWWELRRSS